jgi:glycosyltransferase involved in cell wall biosynthesis
LITLVSIYSEKHSRVDTSVTAQSFLGEAWSVKDTESHYVVGVVMRKVAFDVRTRRLTGIYRYGSTLLEHLDTLLQGTDIKLYVLYRPDTQEQAAREISRNLPQEQVELVAVNGDYGRIPRSQWIREWVVREGIELYYSIDFVVDKDLPVPYIYTVHDIFLQKYPEYFYSSDKMFRARFGEEEYNLMLQDLETVKAYVPDMYVDAPAITQYIWAMSRYLAEKSRHIIVSTESSKAEIIKYLAAPASKVTVILAAADASFFYPRSDEVALQVVQKYSLSENYCIGVGLDLKHKRLSWLLETLAQCRERFPLAARIAIVGKYDNLDQWHQQVSDLGLERLVVFPGRVSDEELAALYTKARALILPSLDEGFGMPTVEALLCGTEVIVPDTDVLREVAGPGGHYYGVHDQNRLGHLITQAFQGTLPLRAKYFQNRFSWDESARQFLDLLKLILNGESANAPAIS